MCPGSSSARCTQGTHFFFEKAIYSDVFRCTCVWKQPQSHVWARGSSACRCISVSTCTLVLGDHKTTKRLLEEMHTVTVIQAFLSPNMQVSRWAILCQPCCVLFYLSRIFPFLSTTTTLLRGGGKSLKTLEVS